MKIDQIREEKERFTERITIPVTEEIYNKLELAKSLDRNLNTTSIVRALLDEFFKENEEFFVRADSIRANTP